MPSKTLYYWNCDFSPYNSADACRAKCKKGFNSSEQAAKSGEAHQLKTGHPIEVSTYNPNRRSW